MSARQGSHKSMNVRLKFRKSFFGDGVVDMRFEEGGQFFVSFGGSDVMSRDRSFSFGGSQGACNLIRQVQFDDDLMSGSRAEVSLRQAPMSTKFCTKFGSALLKAA